MKLQDYLKDKAIEIIWTLLGMIILFLLFYAYKMTKEQIIFITLIYLLVFIIPKIVEYLKKRAFYNDMQNKLAMLDKKYLILEMCKEPNFLDAKIMMDILYDVNKNMNEHVKDYELASKDMIEYIMMWIHEIKVPLSTLLLRNDHDNINKSLLNKINNYLEQILYYFRLESNNKDYLIKAYDLKTIINQVLVNQKDDILACNYQVEVDVDNMMVITDSKWLTFALNQIINNSIKYNDKDNKILHIYQSLENNDLILNIYDNGMGIKQSDIPLIFEKGFTGYNGHKVAKSTGMGLYIVAKILKLLNHEYAIYSKLNEYTLIKIYFNKYTNIT